METTATEVSVDRPVGLQGLGLHLRVLGPFEAGIADAVLDLGGPKQRAVLALLALRAPSGLDVDGVIDGLWGDGAPDAARNSVWSYVSNLKSLLGGGIERRRGSYVLTTPVESDAAVFEAALDRARASLSVDPQGASAELRSALALWRGLPYAGLGEIPGLADEIRRLEELRLLGVETRIEADLAAGRSDELVPELRALVDQHPLRERFWAQLMTSLYRSGRQAEALREYERVRELLVEELGVDPSPELQDLELRILRQDEDLEGGAGQVSTERLTFLFTDIEGSTRLWNERPARMADALARHDEILAEAVEQAGGTVFKHTGDGAIGVFARAAEAAEAAEHAQRRLAETEWETPDELRVRMAIDVGDVDVRNGDYFGPPLNRCARILGAANGGQVVLSSSAFDELSSGHHPGVQIKQLGTHRLRGLGAVERLAQLVFVGLPAEFPDLETDAGSVDLEERLEVGGLPGYELRELLGRGEWGPVYRAYQPSVGREVAIRVISSRLSNHPSFVRRFEAHAKSIARLEHPFIVPVHDFWRDFEGAYLVMQLMRGGSLKRAIGEPWAPGAIVRLLRQVGAALAYAHSEGSVHGDIRSENVLLDGQGDAYLSDFGLAGGILQSIGDRSWTRSPSPYRSPEANGGHDLDPRADVFSLAVLTHALLTGVEPGDSGPLPPPSSIVPCTSIVDGVVIGAASGNREDRPDDIPSFVEAMEQALESDGSREPPVRTGLRNPYKGLRAFDEVDAGDFHGRSDLVETLVAAVATRELVAVVGPSGSGKSSAVHAGLVPRLRSGAVPGSDQWFFAFLTPGARPLRSMADALSALATTPMGDLEGRLLRADGWSGLVDELLPASAELVLVVDQFEELFTLAGDAPDGDRFLDLLAAAAGHERMRVVVTLRADFYDRPLEHPALAALVSGGLVTVVPPTIDELVDAIERPAATVGLALEPGLPMRIAGDVVGQSGGLPLLQYALTELVERRGTDLLTGVDYEAIGTVRGNVARRAEAIFAGLGEEEQVVARAVLLRLVTVDEEADDTRRRVRLSELEGLGTHQQTVDGVVRAFGAPRLLSFDRDPVSRAPTVEVAHEALLREWGRLRDWIEDERADLMLARRLRGALAEWEEAGRTDAFLLAGDRLAPFRAWSGSEVLSRDESNFLERSVARADRELEASRRRRRWGMAAMAVAVVMAVALASFAFLTGRRAEEQASLAQEAASEARAAQALATARELAVSAIGVGEDDPQLAMLLALEALDEQPAGIEAPVELRNALRLALSEDRLDRVIPISEPVGGEVPFLHLVLSPDGSTIGVVDDHGVARRVFGSNWELVWSSDDADLSVLALAPGGDRILVQTSDGADGEAPVPTMLEVRSLSDDRVLWSLQLDCAASLGTWSPRGDVVALDLPNCESPELHTVSVLDANSGRRIHEFPETGTWTIRLEFVEGPSGSLLVMTDRGEGTRFLDGTTFEPVLRIEEWGAASPGGELLIAPDGPTVIDVSSGDGIDRLSGHRSGEGSAGLRRDWQAGIVSSQSGYFSPDGARVALANVDEGSHVPVWDVGSGPIEFMIPAGFGADVGFLDSETLVTAGTDGLLKVWDLSDRVEGASVSELPGSVFINGVQASDWLGTVLVWEESEDGGPVAFRFDPTTGRIGGSLPGRGSLSAAPAGSAGVLYLGFDASQELAPFGPLQWWSASTGEMSVVEGCWLDGTDVCPDGSVPEELATVTSVDGTEAGVLYSDGRFRVWRDGPEPVDDVALDLPDVGLLMGFAEGWVVVQTGEGTYDVFDRSTGTREAGFGMDGTHWLRFDRSGSVGVGGGRGLKALSIVSTETWTVEDLNPDLGEGSAQGFALSPTGDRVAVGVSDGHVRVFEVATGRLLDTVPLGSSSGYAIHWLNGSHLIVGSDEGEWVVLTLDVDELAAQARDRVKRDFTPNECSLYRLDCDA